MTALNKQALRESAIHAQSNDDWGCDGDNFHDQATPDVVLELLDELEAAQSYAKDRDEENQDLMLTIGRLRVEREASEIELDNALCELLPGTQYMDPPDGGSVTPMEQVRRMVADYRGRIEELESRTVNLPEALNSYAGVKIYRPNDVIEAIRAAGIGVKGGE